MVLKGYVKVSGKEAFENAKKAREFITKVQEERKRKFIKWARWHFAKTRARKYWWQFWKTHRKHFETDEAFWKAFHLIGYDRPFIVYHSDWLMYQKIDPMVKKYDDHGLLHPERYHGFTDYLTYKKDTLDYANSLLYRIKDEDELYLDIEKYGRLRFLCDMEF